jgi:outer membrane protein TolC
VRTGEGFPEIDWDQYRWSAGLDLDLPIDRKAERNSYRAALINQDRSARALELAIDNIKLQIREDWRILDQARRTFDISEIGVAIADRRVLEQTIRLENGQGLAKDLVDAQSAQLTSQNARTAALIGHTLARLRFYRDMGIITINEDGTWNEEPPQLSAK